MDNIGKLPHEEQIKTLGNIVGPVGTNPIMDDEQRAVFEKARQLLLAIPGHAQYFADALEAERSKLKPGQTGGMYDTHRFSYLQETLAHLPSPETIRVLGNYLADDRDTPPPQPSDCISAPENSFMASEVLVKIGLRNPPVSEIGIYRDRDNLAKHRAWWEKIKSGALAFSFVGRNVEYRFKPDGTWEATPIASPPNDGVKSPKTANTAQERISQQTPLPKATGTPLVGHLWAWIIGGMLVAVGGVLWIRLRFFARQ